MSQLGLDTHTRTQTLQQTISAKMYVLIYYQTIPPRPLFKLLKVPRALLLHSLTSESLASSILCQYGESRGWWLIQAEQHTWTDLLLRDSTIVSDWFTGDHPSSHVVFRDVIIIPRFIKNSLPLISAHLRITSSVISLRRFVTCLY